MHRWLFRDVDRFLGFSRHNFKSRITPATCIATVLIRTTTAVHNAGVTSLLRDSVPTFFLTILILTASAGVRVCFLNGIETCFMTLSFMATIHAFLLKVFLLGVCFARMVFQGVVPFTMMLFLVCVFTVQMTNIVGIIFCFRSVLLIIFATASIFELLGAFGNLILVFTWTYLKWRFPIVLFQIVVCKETRIFESKPS